jgi:hypothetical protein
VRVSAAVWKTTPELIVRLDERFGEPLDAYVNGSQVWLRDDGPGGIPFEWRLHPVPNYQRPKGVGTYDIFPDTALAISEGKAPPAQLEELWDGREVFAAYGDDIEPQPLVSAAVAALGLEPDAAGLVDHGAVGDDWERTAGAVSIVDALLRQLGSAATSGDNP